MWERAEYQNGDVKIQTKLLDIAVAFATDDVLVRVTNLKIYKTFTEKKAFIINFYIKNILCISMFS